ncbi:hypothetical protein ACFQJ7_17155 [Halovenus rubra]|uniref:Uncharacterized protein n=2 Tax=Halovenus rubra TaxID=869890 RepID=A0ABD5X9B3_9EURY|nr:hypothetical protein [Halovenus rubra]
MVSSSESIFCTTVPASPDLTSRVDDGTPVPLGDIPAGQFVRGLFAHVAITHGLEDVVLQRLVVGFPDRRIQIEARTSLGRADARSSGNRTVGVQRSLDDCRIPSFCEVSSNAALLGFREAVDSVDLIRVELFEPAGDTVPLDGRLGYFGAGPDSTLAQVGAAFERAKQFCLARTQRQTPGWLFPREQSVRAKIEKN